MKRMMILRQAPVTEFDMLLLRRQEQCNESDRRDADIFFAVLRAREAAFNQNL
jgi:hypothetical protein